MVAEASPFSAAARLPCSTRNKVAHAIGDDVDFLYAFQTLDDLFKWRACVGMSSRDAEGSDLQDVVGGRACADKPRDRPLSFRVRAIPWSTSTTRFVKAAAARRLQTSPSLALH